jgi:hypothetical protein
VTPKEHFSSHLVLRLVLAGLVLSEDTADSDFVISPRDPLWGLENRFACYDYELSCAVVKANRDFIAVVLTSTSFSLSLFVAQNF